MVVIRFGKWVSKAGKIFKYERIFTNECKPLPLCVKKFRHVGINSFGGSVEPTVPPKEEDNAYT